ncbi:G-protein coupled receptor 12-like [Phascolarctos cinereus]|uniref:G-protein coupled receptor 12-like n=1 Tax=Phascolarctos cinereus TaxID=38626 RepID=A0A6P5JP18_PHACI|nr:G-protein coupled receptor 12-like [Phascolarctos cinereus]
MVPPPTQSPLESPLDLLLHTSASTGSSPSPGTSPSTATDASPPPPPDGSPWPPNGSWPMGRGRGLGGGEGVSPWDIALCAAGTVMACENALVLAVLCCTPSLRAPTFMLIGSLALADLLAGVGLVANFVVRCVMDPVSDAVALCLAGLLLSAFSASACSLLAITVDRYLSLYNALTYQAERTLPFTCGLLAALWLTCLGIGALPAMGWHCLDTPDNCSVLSPLTKDQAAGLSVSYLFLFSFILHLYLQICRVAFRHAQQIAVQRHIVNNAGSPMPSAFCLMSSTRKGVSTLSLILATFAFCWVPLAVYAMVADPTYPQVYTYYLALPAACHSAINPVVYGFRNPEIQRSLSVAYTTYLRSLFSRPRAASSNV